MADAGGTQCGIKLGASLPFTLSGVPLAKKVAVLEVGVKTLRPNLTLGAS